ncbi:oxidoreductase [Sphingopyxis yananensis]|uniref:oxidoreductase n=1 Tax=Sphingopyxis yananensis TaxID=2886687 RepID=UPI001D109CC9|nr:FAD-dependent oxidoreductase [Sphingopyxis yananensis]MCC2603712.1 NAD(P)/FAD-dependent oxidoreductase [Sphingopyxis yananensis]
MSAQKHPSLTSVGRIGQMDIRNRMAVTAMGVSLSEEDGSCGERLIAYHEEQAKGGAGLIILGVAGVAWPVGAVARNQIAISDDQFLPGLRDLCDRVHAHGAKIAAQLHHGGLIAQFSHAVFGHPLWAPAIPPQPSGDFTEYFLTEELALLEGMTMPSVKVLEQADIDLVVSQFGQGARRAKEAGFDGIEIHAGHGYLLSSFISPITNSRTDAYGGSLENRAKLLLDVVRAVRGEVGADFPVWVKMDSQEVGQSNGITVETAKELAQLLEAEGVDALTITTYHDTGRGKLHSASHTPHDPISNLPATAAIKASVSIPVIGSGRISPDAADKAISAGELDFVAMGRKLLADPHLPRKIMEGTPDKVRPCVYCYTCISAIYMGDVARCAINADLGHEYKGAIPPASSADQRHYVVIGGGPSGMEASRRLAAAGNRVTLLEKSAHLGGTMRFASLAYEPNEHFLLWLKAEVAAAGVDVRLSTEATPELIKALNPDAVLVGNGAIRAMPDIPGGDLPHVLSGDDLRGMMMGESTTEIKRKTSLFTRLATKVGAATGATANLALVRKATKSWMPLGDKIVIIGGELVGIELAEFLIERGRHVTVIDDDMRFGRGLTLVRRMRILEEIAEHGAVLHKGAQNVRITDAAVIFTDPQGAEQRVAADHVIVATGATANPQLADQLEAAGLTVYRMGDSRGVTYIEGAVRSATDAVRDIMGAEPISA